MMFDAFLLDSLGYVIVDDVIPDTTVAAAHSQLDTFDMWARIAGVEGSSPRGTWHRAGDDIVQYLCCIGDGHVQCGPLVSWPHDISSVLRSPLLLELLDQLFPAGHYLDHASLALARSGSCGIGLHGGGHEPDLRQQYDWKHGSWSLGCTVLAIPLVTSEAGMGGTAVVPGSHKSNVTPTRLPPPEEFAATGWIDCPAMRPGQVLVVPEATTHGAVPWRHHGDRRCIIAKYYPDHLANLGTKRRSAELEFWSVTA